MNIKNIRVFRMSEEKLPFNIISDEAQKNPKKFDKYGTTRWENLTAEKEILPEFKDKAYQMVYRLLGYVPTANILEEYTPGIKAALKLIESNTWSYDYGYDEIYKQVQTLRNAEMLHYDGYIYDMKELEKKYKETEFPYGQAVRERLIRLLGEMPEHQYAIFAELRLRLFMGANGLKADDPVTAFDYDVLTLIYHRRTLLTEGRDAANGLLLIPTLYFTDQDNIA